jgi:hypothetical protein
VRFGFGLGAFLRVLRAFVVKFLARLGLACTLAPADEPSRLMANAGYRKAALDILARLDERDCQTTPS